MVVTWPKMVRMWRERKREKLILIPRFLAWVTGWMEAPFTYMDTQVSIHACH